MNPHIYEASWTLFSILHIIPTQCFKSSFNSHIYKALWTLLSILFIIPAQYFKSSMNSHIYEASWTLLLTLFHTMPTQSFRIFLEFSYLRSIVDAFFYSLHNSKSFTKHRGRFLNQSLFCFLAACAGIFYYPYSVDSLSDHNFIY